VLHFEIVLRGPAPIVVDSEDGRGPAAVLVATSTRASRLNSWSVGPTRAGRDVGAQRESDFRLARTYDVNTMES
jgi:hypothetical protein